jgi:hypothetical protein
MSDTLASEEFTSALAWEYCEKCRLGQKVVLKDYLQQLPDDPSRLAFLEAVRMSPFLDAVMAYQAQRTRTSGDNKHKAQHRASVLWLGASHVRQSSQQPGTTATK